MILSFRFLGGIGCISVLDDRSYVFRNVKE